MTASDIVVCHRCCLLHCESSFPWSWPLFFFPWHISLSPEKHPLTVLKMSLIAWLKSSSEKREQSEAEDEDHESTSSCSATSSTVTCDDSPPKKKKVRAYTSVWEKEFSWLEFDESSQVMKRSICLKTRQKNSFVSGCTNFQKNALTRHESTANHKAASAADKRQTDMAQSVKRAQKPRRLWLSTKVLVHKCHLYNVCWFFFFFFFDMDDVGTPLN